jgi:hypothetical protein
MFVILTLRAVLLVVLAVPRWTLAHLVAAVPLAVLGWGLLVLAKPYRECRWCRKRGWLSKVTRHGKRRCFRCKGRKLTRRLGAYHVHKVKLSLIQAWEEREFWR